MYFIPVLLFFLFIVYFIFALLFTKADLLTNEQVEEFKTAFNLFDKDFDGKLNNKEVIMTMKSLGKTFPLPCSSTY